nr:AAA family ATPase [Actinomycetota bacterium]
MKLAMVGKGGVGKTSISGTLARLLARRGRRVLAIDGDPNPNLALTLGVPPEQME